MVAVLCASKGGPYVGMPGVDVFTRSRDARTFGGGMPVVAHPPCRAFSRFYSHRAKPEPGEVALGVWCVRQVERWGGVLEHPASSKLFELAGCAPTIFVNQSWFGHRCRKRTALYIVGLDLDDLPPVGFALRGRSYDFERLSSGARSRTPKLFAEWLVEVAARCRRPLHIE